MRNASKSLVGKPERKRTLGRPRHKWEDNVEIDIKEVWCMCAPDLTGSNRVQLRALVNTVMKVRFL
jgi:hypothetical protein